MIDQDERLHQINRAVKTRNIYLVRELLLQNLADCVDDPDFLNACYQVVKGDTLIFHAHDKEALQPVIERWSKEACADLEASLKRNFSQLRYATLMKVKRHLHELALKEKAELELAQLEEEEQEALKKRRKKLRERIRLPKRKKKIRPEKEKNLLGAVETTTFLIIVLIIKLILGI